MGVARKGEKPSLLYAESRRYRTEVKALGANVRRLRTAEGWTLQVAEEKTGVDWKHLQKIERGRLGQVQLNVTLVTICRLARAFGCSIADLFRRPRRSARHDVKA